MSARDKNDQIVLGQSQVALTTAEAAVTAPASLTRTARSIVVGARSGGAFVEWMRKKNSTDTYGVTCLDSKEAIEIKARPSQVPFYAYVNSGTATLEVEWIG